MLNTSSLPYRHLSERLDVKAAKAHRCDTCQGTIAPGARYNRDAYLSHGRFVAVKYHRLCEHPFFTSEED